MIASPFPSTVLRRFGAVAAGFPSPAQGYEDEPLDLNALLIRHPAATYFYRVRGDALRGQGIRDGSLLVVDRSISPRPGRLVIADRNGQREVMRMPARLEDDQTLEVWGAVTAVITRMKS